MDVMQYGVPGWPCHQPNANRLSLSCCCIVHSVICVIVCAVSMSCTIQDRFNAVCPNTGRVGCTLHQLFGRKALSGAWAPPGA